jgi:hypothetical protein
VVGLAINPERFTSGCTVEIGGMAGLFCILKVCVLLFATLISAVFILICLPILPIPEPARHGLPA